MTSIAGSYSFSNQMNEDTSLDNLKPGVIPLVDRAIGFAARAHKKQMRKTGEKMPYIAHPFAVGMFLQQMGCSETLVAAGILHDTVEDTDVTIKDIEEQFGEAVALIVAGCTEPPKKYLWASRKKQMIEQLREAPIEVKIVAAADKYHNLNHTLVSSQLNGSKIWKQFGQGKRRQAWYYRSVFESIVANVEEPEEYRIFGLLDEVIQELFRGVISNPP